MKRKWITMLLAFCVIVSLVIPFGAAAETEIVPSYVTDWAGLLSEPERESLEQQAASIADELDCGVYIITLDDMRDFNRSDIFELAVDLYHDNSLGNGEDRDGVLLVMSMEDRDYALFFYGEWSEYAFDSYGQEMLEEEFLDDFGNDDWYAGFSDYLDTCEEYLELAEQGDPVRASAGPVILIVIGVSMLVALIVCLVIMAGMKNVRTKIEANTYVAAGSFQLTDRQDIFTHTTERRTKISSDSVSGSSARSGGGGSGRSGKF